MDDETNVVLTANTAPYEQNVDRATAATNRMLDAVGKLTVGIDQAFRSAGRSIQFGGAGLVASMTAAGYAAGRLDHQMSQLQAAMTMATRSQGEFEQRMGKMSSTVTSLRKEFGQTSTEAIALVTQLNRMGQGARDVDRLAQSFTRLSAVSGEGVQGLVDGMISLQRAMGTEGTRQTEVFNASLAKVSQTAGASATQILQFSAAIAPVAKVSGMTTKEVLGFSAAFVKAGADGYSATTAFNKMLTDITRSIQYGSPELKAYSNLIGKSVDEFKRMNRSEAIVQVFEAINKQGPQAIKTLERFGLDGIRTYKSLQAVASQGGIRAAMTDVMGGSNEKQMGTASERAFDGLNDQMKKLTENGKMMAEAFGSGVLPVMEGLAKAVNAVLSPITALLQAMGKFPGGAAMIAGVGAMAAGSVVKHFTGLSSIGLATGMIRTVRGGWRAGAKDFESLSGREQRDLLNHQAWTRGEPARGNWLQHQIFGGFEGMGARAREGNLGQEVGNYWASVRDRARGVGIWGVSALGSMFRAGLDPLSFRAGHSNFNRDQNVQLFSTSRARDALGWSNVSAAWQGLKEGDLRATVNSNREFAKSLNTSADSTRKYNTVLGALAVESRRLASSLGQAAVSTAYFGAKGAVTVGGPLIGRGMAAAGRGISAIGNTALGMVGGYGGAAALGIGYLWNKQQENIAANEEMFRSKDSASPLSQYSAAVGEAAQATRTFADVLKEKSNEIGSAKFTPEVSERERAVAASDRTGLTYKGLEGASPEQAKAIVSAVRTGNPSDRVMQTLKGDLLKVFGTDQRGASMVEEILKTAPDGSRLDLTALFGSAADKQKLTDVWGLSDAARKQAQSVGDTLGALYTTDNSESAARRTLVAGNMLNKAVSQRGVFGHGGDEAMALAYVRGVLGERGTQDDVNAVMTALGETQGMSGNARYTEFQNQLIKSGTAIGKSVQTAISGAGSNFNRASMEMPTNRTYYGSWSGSGIDEYVRQQMVGGAGGATAQFVFGNPSSNSAASRAVYGAMRNEGDVNAQWQGMKELADAARATSGSFTGAIADLDKLKAAAGDSSSALYKMANQAQEYLRVRQSEAMVYMSRPEQIAQLRQNFEASQQSFINNPNQESGQNLERDRAALESAKADTFARLKSFMTQVREFNISQSRAAEDYIRAREHAEEDFARSQQYALDDYNRSRKYSEQDFQKSRRRAEEDFNHQVVVMARNAARQIMNIYERINVQRTWSASNLLANMADQQQRLAEQQANLGRLRGAGLSGEAISMLGLNEPGNAQQLARLTDEMVNDPAMIKAYNKAVQERMKAATKVVTDKDSEQWKEMQYAFQRNMAHGQEDYDVAMKRQEDQFALMQARQVEQFGISMARMEEQYQIGMDRSAADLNRSMEEITGGFTELAQDALATLTGAAQDQLTATLAALGYTRQQIKLITQGVYDDIEKIFNKLGVSDTSGTPTLNGKKLMTGTINLPGGGRINAGQFAQGGEIHGRSSHNQADNIPVWATAGEFMQPVDAVNYYGKEAMEAIQKRKIPKGLLQGFADGGPVYKAMEAWVAKNIPNIGVTSDYRPGAITATGYVSQHALGRAVDLAPPSMDAFNKIRNTFNKSILELIYSPAGYQQMYMGKNKYYGEPTRGDHWNHIHWAMQAFGKSLQAAFPEINVWDGTLDQIVDLVKKSKNLTKLDKTLSKAPHPAIRQYGHGFTQQSALIGALGRLDVDRIDDDYKNIKKIDWKGDGGIFDSANVVGVGERGPEVVLPLDNRGVDFMFEVMKKNASESKRAMLATTGVPQRASTVSYYQRVDKSTTISGPITVQSQDPDDMLRKIEAKKRLEALKGRN